MAFHEAGHAFVAHRLGLPIEWVKLQRLPWDWDGSTKVSERSNPAKGTADWCRITLGGPVAEAVHLGVFGVPDNEECLGEWHVVVGHLGGEVAGRMLGDVRDEVSRPTNWARIDAFATRLLEVNYLSGQLASEILGLDVW